MVDGRGDMPDSFANLLRRVQAGRHLDRDAMAAAIGHLTSGAAEDESIGAFLTALAAKGETAEEVAGAAAAMRWQMTRIQSRHACILDTCGTGGGGSELFNVSTGAALVIAAAGVPVAKHGNRSITSRSGSADVLGALGVNIDADAAQVERCLNELGICFCFAQRMHPAMRTVSAVRKKLGVRTIFNILGPLCNPAGATHQLLGSGRPELRPVLAGALRLLDTQRALVVSGQDGLGEVTLACPTNVTEVDAQGVRERQFDPAEFGLHAAPLDALRVSHPDESAAMLRKTLAGERGAARDMVVLNSAAGLCAFDAELTPLAAASRAAEAIDSGAAHTLLRGLIELSWTATS